MNTSLKNNQMKYLHYARVITLKRVSSGGANLRSLASGQHSSQRNVAAVATLYPI